MTQSTRPSTVPFAESWSSVLFDLVRGLAALVVFFGHWGSLFFVDLSQIVAHRHLLAILYLIIGAGHQAVIVFFLLSGYLVGGSILRDFDHHRWSWRAYLLRRIVRLWIVLLPALLLCLLWDKLGIHLGHAPALYSGLSSQIIPDVAPLLSAKVFFGNLFFLQNIHAPKYGSDGALWSLANEFWYYLLFPLAAVALNRYFARTRRIAAVILFLAAAWFVRGGILWLFPLWLAGVLLYRLPTFRLPPSSANAIRIVATLVYLPIFFLLSKSQFLPSVLNDYILGVLTFFLLWLLLTAHAPSPAKSHRVRLSRELARFSYTLYAVHLPFLALLLSLVLGDNRFYPSWHRLLVASAVLLATALYAYALAFVTEFRTDALRTRLEHLFHLRHARPELPSNPLQRR